MLIRLLAVIFLSGLLAACNSSPENKGDQEAHFVDEKAQPTAPAQPQAPPPPPAADSPAPQAQVTPSKPSAPVEPSKPVVAPPAQEPAPAPSTLITEGHLRTELPEYQIPQRVRERIARFQPEILPPAQGLDFDITDHHLNIDVKTKTVTFAGVLKIKGKADEPFELSCHIDTTQVTWVCRDLLPTDPKLARQKRLQGTFMCLDTYVCDNVGVAVWVVIDGKLQDPPKLFQAHGFRLRRATSGDQDDTLDNNDKSKLQQTPEPAPEQPSTPPVKRPPKGKWQDRVPQDPNGKNEKAPPEAKSDVIPLPRARPPGAPTVKPAQPSDEDVDTILDNPEASIEISEPMRMPTPSVGKYSVPGIEKLHARIGEGSKVQAVGWHNSGSLQKASEFPQSGAGFISRDHGKRDFGTDLTVDLISSALAQMNKKYPGRPPVVLGQVANRIGGTLYNLKGQPHLSHKTGLDADVGLPSTRTESQFFSACGEDGCDGRSSVTSRFDVERFWMFIKEVSCADNQPVIVMFLDRKIKRYVCNYVRNTAHENMNDRCVVRTLQALRHEEGHDNHVHVRLRCPESSSCYNTWVTLANGTGC